MEIKGIVKKLKIIIKKSNKKEVKEAEAKKKKKRGQKEKTVLLLQFYSNMVYYIITSTEVNDNNYWCTDIKSVNVFTNYKFNKTDVMICFVNYNFIYDV